MTVCFTEIVLNVVKMEAKTREMFGFSLCLKEIIKVPYQIIKEQLKWKDLANQLHGDEKKYHHEKRLTGSKKPLNTVKITVFPRV